MDTKKPSIAIVGHVDHGKSTLEAALITSTLITAAEHEKVVIIGASDVNAQQQRPFEPTQSYQYKNYHTELINGIQPSGKESRREIRKNKRKNK